jgi:hypothetical protein
MLGEVDIYIYFRFDILEPGSVLHEPGKIVLSEGPGGRDPT